MEIVFAFCFFIVFFFAMAIGVIVKGKPLKGSCGGVATLMGNESCEICGGDPNKCDENLSGQSGVGQSGGQSGQSHKDLSYNAMKDENKNS